MPSVIPGYEYDIFISYRQKDNRSDHWVTKFVQALNEELESTFKEVISIYFDENPRDGLLETHDVDQSLNEKVKALIFIPIISQTYCDPDCFAWQKEFLAFRDFAKKDEFGLDIKLANGNVAKRILSVKIHEIEDVDKKLLEDEIGGVMRSVDFIYSEPGVNRSLRPEDDRKENLKNTDYRNQVNKVANAIKEVIFGLQDKPLQSIVSLESKTIKTTEDSIAVLPFVNMSNDPEQEYFSDGISEEIINMLAQIPGLKVTGRTSSFSFKGKNVDLREIGKMLNVNMLLEGSVRKSGNKVRITAQLVKTENGYHQWSEKYDRKLDDIFKVQDEIAKSIVDHLQLTFSSKKEISTSRQQTGNVAAYDLCLKGRQLLYERGLSIFDAIHCFQKAVALDPDYALAYAGLADANSILGYYGMLPPKETWPQAIRGAEKAIELGPDLAESHCAKAIVYHAHDWEWDKAINEWQIALEINPNYEQARTWYGLFSLQFVQGKNDEAHEQLNIAIENDPLSFYTNSVMGLSLGASGETSEGIKYAKRGVELDPTSYYTIWILGCCYHWAHHFGKAEKELQTALDLSGRHAWALHELLVTYVNWGKKDKARIIYDEIKMKSRQKYIQPSILASVCAAMGDNDLAMDYINKAYDTHDPSLAFWSKYFPSFGALYKIPGYEVIWQRMGLP